MTDEQTHFLTVELDGGNRLVFDTFQQVEQWLSNERNFWSWLTKAPLQDTGQLLTYRNEFTQAHSAIQTSINELKSDLKNQSALQSLRKTIQRSINSGKIILRDNPSAVIAADIAQNIGAAAGAAALSVLLKIPFQTGQIVQGIVEATLLKDGAAQRSPQLLEKALNDVLVVNQPKIDKAVNDLATKSGNASSLLQDIKTELDTFLSKKEQNWTDINDRINNEMNAVIKSIKDTEAAYKSQMELQASVDYWTEKAKKHTLATASSQSILMWFSIIGGCGLVALLVALSLWAGAIAGGDIAIYLKFAAVGAVAVTIVFWIARVLLRIFLSDRHLATDAEERVVMVKTFLALANEKQIEPADRALVLGPLFRSAADGIVRDEGPDASLAGIIARAVDLKAKS